jgi:hypothetical protein
MIMGPERRTSVDRMCQPGTRATRPLPQSGAFLDSVYVSIVCLLMFFIYAVSNELLDCGESRPTPRAAVCRHCPCGWLRPVTTKLNCIPLPARWLILGHFPRLPTLSPPGPTRLSAKVPNLRPRTHLMQRAKVRSQHHARAPTSKGSPTLPLRLVAPRSREHRQHLCLTMLTKARHTVIILLRPPQATQPLLLSMRRHPPLGHDEACGSALVSQLWLSSL